ncbi:MAG: hypothetical protein ACREP9_08325 [Candidatus Dormibacteraceae bacterium]
MDVRGGNCRTGGYISAAGSQLFKEGALEGHRAHGRLLIGEHSLLAWAARRGRILKTSPPTMEALRRRRNRIWSIAQRLGVRSLAVFGSELR